MLKCGNGDRAEAEFRYAVGCDGAHSTVRRSLGIAFEGDSIPYDFMLGDVHIDWNTPRGTVVRAIRPIPDAPPDLFIAIPLPEQGRYRVSTLAPPELASLPRGTDHGIQSERAARDRPSPNHRRQNAARKGSPERYALVFYLSHQHASGDDITDPATYSLRAIPLTSIRRPVVRA